MSTADELCCPGRTEAVMDLALIPQMIAGKAHEPPASVGLAGE
jgi:hypothetical protein